jgi:hypothetical protein
MSLLRVLAGCLLAIQGLLLISELNFRVGHSLSTFSFSL